MRIYWNILKLKIKQTSKYHIKISKNNQFYWILKARNGKIILTASEQYTTKQNCIKSIEASKKYITIDKNLRIFIKDNYVYFAQFAKNGEQLGRSEMYSTKQGALKGIKSVIKNAVIAITENKK